MLIPFVKKKIHINSNLEGVLALSKLQIAPKKLGNTYQPENHNDFKMILKFGESRDIGMDFSIYLYQRLAKV
jgi:hypothetical protein